MDDLTVSFEYRLICTPGSCGSDCSQTTGCAGFPAACPAGCGASDPCLNGGTCTVSVHIRTRKGLGSSRLGVCGQH